ncbi:MAG: hypothetical protein AB7I33_15790 [Gemmatimonadales bacterium]
MQFVYLGMAVMALLSGRPHAALPQSGRCHPDTAVLRSMATYYTSLATRNDSAAQASRAALTIPEVPAEEVVPVTSDSVCATAAAALTALLGPPASGSREVYVVRVGAVYVVWDPTLRAGHFDVSYVFDDRFQNVLSRILG